MELSCPISAERINENVVRVIAFMVAAIAIACIVFSNYWAIVFLLFDFAVRAFTSGKFSLLKFMAVKVSNAFSLSPKMKDLAPKKFAATLGFGFCLLITAVFLFDFYNAALIFTSIMIVFALLESLFAVCVGCYIYSFLQIFAKKNGA
ncbi:hypothetical protein SRABI27_00618 [Pedobacter sp. Bi27]|uniref:DUF4395 domain-containing protein n=1 Tax=unclassified Pedobacter TaxID=2628915 RepID=UPI001DB164F5|nr:MULTISPECIES: DUF4395 domain-containing protein [unclassified Pedobacter]CAH0154520.1 hypothetical protein SRABI126_00619 [Pedobacter sp. Bi126]CAH0155014.1 hypothetical protein SRABI27_00618 [Pedobacter sp. Bi27]CAH0203787.1 hypothetical protein SRABI36_02061 [Pedobacter sp. Bi36]